MIPKVIKPTPGELVNQLRRKRGVIPIERALPNGPCACWEESQRCHECWAKERDLTREEVGLLLLRIANQTPSLWDIQILRKKLRRVAKAIRRGVDPSTLPDTRTQ